MPSVPACALAGLRRMRRSPAAAPGPSPLVHCQHEFVGLLSLCLCSLSLRERAGVRVPQAVEKATHPNPLPILFGTRFAGAAFCSFPPGGGRWGWGGEVGHRRATGPHPHPRPPPSRGREHAGALTAKFVPNSIDPLPGGEGKGGLSDSAPRSGAAKRYLQCLFFPHIIRLTGRWCGREVLVHCPAVSHSLD